MENESFDPIPALPAPSQPPACRRGRGAPPGNKNALKHGFYSRRVFAAISLFYTRLVPFISVLCHPHSSIRKPNSKGELFPICFLVPTTPQKTSPFGGMAAVNICYFTPAALRLGENL